MLRSLGVIKSRRKEVDHPFPVRFKKEIYVAPIKQATLVQKFLGEGNIKTRRKFSVYDKSTMGFRDDFSESGNSASDYDNSLGHIPTEKSKFATLLSILGLKKKITKHFHRKDKSIADIVIPKLVDDVTKPIEPEIPVEAPEPNIEHSSEHHTKKVKRKKHHPTQNNQVKEKDTFDEIASIVIFDYKQELKEIDDEEANYAGISLMDYDMHRKGRIVSYSRTATREAKRREDRERGIIDAVTKNSGPDPILIPAGWKSEPHPPIVLNDTLLKRRCMVYWDVEKEAKGWFVGTITGECNRDNLNFLIKYDRSETGNLFVDGVKPTSLQFMGEDAYGVSWILLVKVIKLVTTPIRPSTSDVKQKDDKNDTIASDFDRLKFESRSLPMTPYSPMIPVTHERTRSMSANFSNRFTASAHSKVFCMDDVDENQLSPLNPRIGIPSSITLPFIQNMETNF